MVHATAIGPPDRGVIGIPLEVPRCADASGTQPTQLTEGSLQSRQFVSGAGHTDEAPDPVLIQLRYDDYVAQHALQTLFESGQLECMGW
jgi:hypothetical protein